MIDFIFIAFFICFPILIILLMNRIGLSLLRFSIPSFVIIAMLVSAYIGILPLYFGLDQAAIARGVQNQMVIWQVFFFSSYTIISMVIGFAFSKYALFGKISYQDVRIVEVKRNEFIVLLFMLIVCMFVLFFYLRQISEIALFVALFSGTNESEVARSLMGNDFSGHYYRYSYFMHDLLSITSFSFFVLTMIRRNMRYKIAFAIAFSCASFIAVMATQKAPFMWLLIGHFIVFTFVKYNGAYPIKAMMKLFFFLFIVLIIFYLYFAGFGSIDDAINAILSRLFAASIGPAYFYIEYFPDHHPFLLGRSFSNPGSLLPYTPYKLTIEIFNWMEPEFAKRGGVVGTAPTVFWAEMYANFGYLGVLIPPFFVGILLYVLHVIFARLQSTPLMVGFAVWTALHYRVLSVSALSSFIIDIKFVFITSLIIFFLFVLGKGTIKFSYSKK